MYNNFTVHLSSRSFTLLCYCICTYMFDVHVLKCPPRPHTYTEYIVMFNAYYTSDARDGFISAALKLHPDWSIVPRSNPSQDYPSDFSLVQLRTHVPRAVTSLEHHPTVKRVTPQRKLTRMLAFSSEGVCVCVCVCVFVFVCRGVN